MTLPIEDILKDFTQEYLKNSAVILSAAPGAGKTTRIPVEIAKNTKKQVWVLEPRRIAAVSAANRIAEENKWTLGKEVGYNVRFDNKSSNETKILFLTEALLLRKLLNDPDLKNVDCVVLDEFHERSLHVDIALAALKEVQELSRPDLKIVIMSATLNANPLSEYFQGAPVVESAGKIFPLDIRFDDKAQLLSSGPDFIERIKKLVLKAVNENSDGDLLCFLPGRGEIERLRELLEASLPNTFRICPLHGQLQLQDQKQAILPIKGFRKIILATNIAESSLTVEGVRIVVDCGLSRLQQQSPKTGFESLVLSRISKASATQRAGRAARLGPGVVYRAWSVHDDKAMAAFETAEIHRVDLSEALLLLAALGVSQVSSFSWFEKPNERSLQMAAQVLQILGAVDSQGAITALGKKMREFPVHPRLAKLLITGESVGMGAFAAEIAALLSDAKPLKKNSFSGAENDVLAHWEDWQSHSSQGRYKFLNRVMDQLKNLVSPNTKTISNKEEALEQLLIDVYADRLCRRRKPQSAEAKMVGGRGVKIHSDSSVKQAEYFLAIELSEGRDSAHATVFQAVGLQTETIEEKIAPLAQSQSRLEWDADKKKFWSIDSKEWNKLSIGAETRRPAKSEDIQNQLVDVAIELFADLLSKNESLGNWFARLNFLNSQKPEYKLLTEEQIKEALAQACYGENSLEALEKKEMVTFFENQVAESTKNALHKECPSHLTVPTGNRYRIQYTEEQGPLLEVRLQELFGLTQTPIIAGVPVTLSLLAPNFRPVQVTRDIISFWKNGYPEVRKEMRTRYPKHSWPDDPLTAPPQAKGRHHNK